MHTYRLAALEIAKFQDQLIKRLNEDVMLQLSHDDVVGGHTAPGPAGPSSSSSSSSSSAAGGGNNPATEAVLLHGNFHHHRLAGGGGHGVGVGGPPHEWNFAKAFLYSLTVLTTIGKCHPGSLSSTLPDRDSNRERERDNASIVRLWP